MIDFTKHLVKPPFPFTHFQYRINLLEQDGALVYEFVFPELFAISARGFTREEAYLKAFINYMYAITLISKLDKDGPALCEPKSNFPANADPSEWRPPFSDDELFDYYLAGLYQANAFQLGRDGNAKISAEHYGKALTLSTALYIKYPEIDSIALKFSIAMKSLMEALPGAYGTYELDLHMETRLDEQRELVAAYPEHIEFRTSLVSLELFLIELNMHLRDYKTAWKYWRLAENDLSTLMAANPESPTFLNHLALIKIFQGNLLRVGSDATEAAQVYYREAQEILRKLEADMPNAPEVLTNLNALRKLLR